jgi:hypothetical protein
MWGMAASAVQLSEARRSGYCSNAEEDQRCLVGTLSMTFVTLPARISMAHTRDALLSFRSVRLT